MVVESPPEGASAVRDCPRCGSEAEPLQEYCLECGERLPADRPGPGRPAASWVWSALVTAVVALLAAVAVVAIQAADDGSGSVLAPATTEQPPVPATTAPPPAPTEAEQPTTEPEPEPPAQPPAPSNRLVGWPRGERGWTVVLASIPVDDGRSVATRRAREAANAGLEQVGVLVSAEYSSLHPGYFVVFTGVYDTQRQAEQAVALARGRGFDAYPRPIVP